MQQIQPYPFDSTILERQVFRGKEKSRMMRGKKAAESNAPVLGQQKVLQAFKHFLAGNSMGDIFRSMYTYKAVDIP